MISGKQALVFLSVILGMLMVMMLPQARLWANDLDDGISTYTDESIGADDSLGKKGTNINYIVVNAIGKAKMKHGDDPKNKAKEGKKTVTNVYDGKSDNNENSVVVESGSKVDKIYNIVIEK
jgi:hypothetical protein